MAWSPLQEIVTLDEAKAHLALPDDMPTGDESDLTMKLLIAHELVMDYLAQRVSDHDAWQATVDAWTDETAPQRVKGAILFEVGRLRRFRGDDDKQDYDGPPVLCRETRLLLDRFRDPALG